jgi:surface antigen
MREFVRESYGAFRAVSRQSLCRVCCAAAAATVLHGCSISVPMPGLGSDDLPTGSIKPVSATAPFVSEMDAEDWRRAKSALETALDPQGNGASVVWSNPQSGAKGNFVPLAQPYPKDDGICRAFTAVVEVKGQTARTLRSSACRRNGGEWVINKVTPVQRALAALPRKNSNLAERDTDTQFR